MNLTIIVTLHSIAKTHVETVKRIYSTEKKSYFSGLVESAETAFLFAITNNFAEAVFIKYVLNDEILFEKNSLGETIQGSPDNMVHITSPGVVPGV